MPSTTEAPSVVDLAKAEKTIAGLEDARLVEMMLAFLSPFDHPDGDRAPLFGGQTEGGGLYTRTMFMEIASRWIPADVLGPAFSAHLAVVDGGNDA